MIDPELVVLGEKIRERISKHSKYNAIDSVVVTTADHEYRATRYHQVDTITSEGEYLTRPIQISVHTRTVNYEAVSHDIYLNTISTPSISDRILNSEWAAHIRVTMQGGASIVKESTLYGEWAIGQRSPDIAKWLRRTTSDCAPYVNFPFIIKGGNAEMVEETMLDRLRKWIK